MSGHFRRTAALRAVAAVLLLSYASCARAGGGRAPSAPQLNLAGQRVLVLPVQRVIGMAAEARVAIDAELLFALGEREASVVWIAPEELRRALQRSPGLAGDPAALPSDPLYSQRRDRAGDALAGEVRRFSALMDARLVLLPHTARFVLSADGGGAVRLGAALLDARSGRVLWWSEAAGSEGVAPAPAQVATASAALAASLLAVPEPIQSR